MKKEVVAFLNYREVGFVYFGNDDSGSVISALRNKELIESYRVPNAFGMELVEQLGSGVPRILQVYDRNCFKFFPNFIRMTFPRIHEEEGGEIGGAIGVIIDDLTDRQTEILKIIEQDSKISYRKVSELLNINYSAAQAHFDTLKEKRIISRIGDTRGSWKVNYKKEKMNNDIVIKVENLSKVYPLQHPYKDENGVLVTEHWALKDVSFEIKKGESVGIIGPNGSGKSTLLKILAGVTKPTSGKVTIKGKVASILDIGAGFHPELSGRENVYLNGQIHGFSKKEIESKFEDIVSFSGIEKFIDEPVKNYSNGMYLRLAFSIMAHMDFDVYLLDEVLSVGDEIFRTKINKKLNFLSKTFVCVDHDLVRLSQLNLFFFEFQFGEFKRFENKCRNSKMKYKLFGNEEFNLTDCLDSYQISFFDEDNKKNKNFTYYDCIKLKIRLFNPNKTIKVGISLKDQFGSHVFDSIFDENIESMNPVFSLELPATFFNDRKYSIDFFIIQNEKVIFFEKDVLCFSIDNCSSNGGWGIIHPSLTWTLISNE